MKTRHLLAAALLAAAGIAHAQQGTLQVKNEALIEQTVTARDGSKTVTLVPPAKGQMLPGTAVTWIVSIRNTGTARADAVTVDNPMPNDSVFIAGSQTGDGATKLVSVDGGKTYGELAKLTVAGADGKPRAARAEDVTHLRWTLGGALAPGAAASVSFKSRIR